MKSLKALALLSALVCPLTLFAAFQAHIAINGTKQGKNKGEPSFEVSNFSWGASPAANVDLQNRGCATNEIHFSATGDAAAQLMQACRTNEVIPEMELDAFNTHHVLQNARVSCQNNLFTIRFSRCSIHPVTLPIPLAASVLPPISSSPNGQLLLDNTAEPVNLIDVRQPGPNNAVVVHKTSSPTFFRNCVAGAHFKSVTIAKRKAGGATTEYYKVKLTDVYVTGVSRSADGSVSLALKYAMADGPLESFRSAQ